MFMIFTDTENKKMIKNIRSNFDYLEDCEACPIEREDCMKIKQCISSTKYKLIKQRKKRF